MRIAEKIAKIIHSQGHGGPELVRTNLRSQFWIIGESELAKRVYYNCEEGARFRRKNKFKIPKNDALPEQKDLRILTNIGLDHTGAILNDDNEKRYILLIICLATKKICLELVSSLGVESTELVLVRLEAEYGPLNVIRSDNYKTFQALAGKHTGWTFTAPYSPHQGGLWERSIQSVRRVLAPYLHQQYSDNVWRTLLMVAESAVNNKPLVRLLDDPNQRVVTPNKICKMYKFAEESGKRNG